VFLNETDLDPRTIGALNRAGIATVSDLLKWSEHDLSMLQGVGRLSLESIKKVKATASSESGRRRRKS
jgi:DNA-directed RNA polymerase alpha subunit